MDEDFIAWLEENEPWVLDTFRVYDHVKEEFYEQYLADKSGKGE